MDGRIGVPGCGEYHLGGRHDNSHLEMRFQTTNMEAWVYKSTGISKFSFSFDNIE